MRYRVYEPKQNGDGSWTVELVDMDSRSIQLEVFPDMEEAFGYWSNLIREVEKWNKEWEEENRGSD